MGPIALFDKSFLQSLTVDESIWFGHFFMPVVCPLFYVETLADLEKSVREGRTPEQEVGIIASKFPEVSANPCMHHNHLAIAELLGSPVPLDGRIPMAGGRAVDRDGRQGIVYDESPEADAFSRWQNGKFLEVERGMAKAWRAALGAVDLNSMAAALRAMGIDSTTVRSLNDAAAIAHSVVAGRDKPFERLAIANLFLSMPRQHSARIIERWKIATYRPLIEHAPYAAHIVKVDLFFQLALAANLIGAERSSNRVDMAYLYYLPFCMLFVSTDRLHQRCAPYFLRADQEFVWGQDLKADLGRINTHFAAFPESEKDRGIMAFAHAPPRIEGSLVRRLRATFLRPGVDDEPPIPPNSVDHESSAVLVSDLKQWTSAPTSTEPLPDGMRDDPEMLAIHRMVRKRKGSWWQLPKDLKIEPDEEKE